jgi:hypothetical protein
MSNGELAAWETIEKVVAIKKGDLHFLHRSFGSIERLSFVKGK